MFSTLNLGGQHFCLFVLGGKIKKLYGVGDVNLQS